MILTMGVKVQNAIMRGSEFIYSSAGRQGWPRYVCVELGTAYGRGHVQGSLAPSQPVQHLSPRPSPGVASWRQGVLPAVVGYSGLHKL